ncbi:MAG: hypothetical protein FWG65_11555 [Turicibacter sp.]|nr:hypothetical protein [Turicibacter sp.]
MSDKEKKTKEKKTYLLISDPDKKWGGKRGLGFVVALVGSTSIWFVFLRQVQDIRNIIHFYPPDQAFSNWTLFNNVFYGIYGIATIVISLFLTRAKTGESDTANNAGWSMTRGQGGCLAIAIAMVLFLTFVFVDVNLQGVDLFRLFGFHLIQMGIICLIHVVLVWIFLKITESKK